ncbi:hypothetical protein LCGC14_1405460, partial [marine sediment metagenome]
ESPYYYDSVRYDPVENEWALATYAQASWVSLGNDSPLMGLITYGPYLGQGQYDQEYMYYLSITHSYGLVLPPFPPGSIPIVSPTIPRVTVTKKTPGTLTASGWSGVNSDPVLFSDLTSLENREQTWTDSVVFHDKLYFGLCIIMLDTSDSDTYSNGTTMWAPDATYRYPLLIECDPDTMDASEVGLATHMGSAVGNMDFNIHAMAKHDNKLWIDSSQDGVAVLFSGSTNNGSGAVVRDFESSGSTVFAATGHTAELLYSEDYGVTWNVKVDLTYMDASPSLPTLLYCCKEFDYGDATGSYLFVGSDDPSTVYKARAPHTSGSWSITSLPDANMTVIDLTTFGGALYAAAVHNSTAFQSIYETTDGTTWTLVDNSDKGGWAFEQFDSYLYATGFGDDTVIRSSDGTTWTNAVDGLGTAGTSVGYSLEAHNGYLYSTNAAYHLVRTSNGTTWDTRYTGFGELIKSILSYNNTLYVGLNNGELWSSTDDGQTFVLFQIPSAYTIHTLSGHSTYALCGTGDNPTGGIFKWGNSEAAQHYMTTYDGTNFVNDTSPASAGDTILEMHSYGDQLYVIMVNSTGGYTVRRYNGTSWSTHASFSYAINTMYEHNGFLIIALANGEVFYLNTESDTWQQYLDIPDLSFSTNGVTAFASYTMSPTKVYSFVDNAWYSSEFISSEIRHYAVQGATISGSTTQYASIPGYRKQLDFMLNAAMYGGTHQGIISATNAFTLVNPDIRESHTTPQWKLKSITGPITQLSPNVWQFSSSLSWRDNLWQGSHATLISGSSISDKIAAGYVILVNDNNTVDVGPIYDLRLLLDLTRPD